MDDPTPVPADQPLEVHLRDYLRVIRKHLGIASAFFVVVVSAVTLVTLRQTPVYRATATLNIERQWPSSLALEDLITPERPQDEYLKTQQELIRSRPILEAVFKTLRLGESDEFDVPDPIEELYDRVEVTPRSGTYLVDVSIEGGDPEQVARWTNVLVMEYRDWSERSYKSTSRDAEEKLNKQIPELRRKLLQSEEAVTKFLRDNNVVAFDKQLQILFSKLDTLEARFTSIETERVRLVAAHDVLFGHGNGVAIPAHLPDLASSDTLRSTLAREAVLAEAFAKAKSKFRPGHPSYSYAQDELNAIRDRIASEVQRIRSELEAKLMTKQKEKAEILSLIKDQRKAIGELESQSNQYEALKQDLESNRRMYREFIERRKEIESATDLARPEVKIIETARPPLYPVKPKKSINLALAAVVGLLGGIALAFFIEYLDDSLKSPEEIESLGVSLLGVVPDLGKGQASERDLVSLEHPKSVAAESFRAIRTSLTFSLGLQEGPRVYLVTSSSPGEGKTLISTNLALAMAMADKKVLLVDADMRKPSLHNVLELERESGLSDFFAGTKGLDAIVRPGPLPNLSVITCGDIPPNPSELIGSPRMADFLEEVKDRFDVILFDTPPAIAVTDAVVLAYQIDGVIFVIRAEATGKRVASQSINEIKRVGGTVAGTILNHFNARKAGYYRGRYSSYYYYYRYDKYGYGSDADAAETP